jgi:hypothetical protein
VVESSACPVRIGLDTEPAVVLERGIAAARVPKGFTVGVVFEPIGNVPVGIGHRHGAAP